MPLPDLSPGLGRIWLLSNSQDTEMVERLADSLREAGF